MIRRPSTVQLPSRGAAVRRRGRSVFRRAVAFTILELMVSMAVLVVAIFALATIFDMSSETTGRTVAHAEVLEASAAVQERITDQLSKIEPGLLIIESPAPTLARSEVQEGERLFRLRHDRLVFLALGAPGEFQSFTDPTQGIPTNPSQTPASSREALIYFGPGIPLSDEKPPQPLDPNTTVTLTAAEWVFAHRAILLLTDNPNHAVWSPLLPNMNAVVNGLLDNGTLASALPDVRAGRMDAVVSSPDYRANGQTIIDAMNVKMPADLVSPTPTFAGLWDANVTPTSASLTDPNELDYFVRSGFMLQPRLADFRIEWTDGRDNTGAPDYGTRWFGLRPYWDSPVTDPNAVQFKAQCRHDVTSAPPTPSPEEDERLVFESTIEWSNPPNAAADVQAAYRAVWRADTWQYRPKALRFTYRIYDAQNRLKQLASIDFNEDGTADTIPTARWGQEFSIVVPIP